MGRLDGIPMICQLLQNPSHLLAMADMRGNLVAAGVLLALGVFVLRLVEPTSDTPKSRWRLVGVAFVCGPAAALAWFVADIFWISPRYYLMTGDYAESLPPILIIGFISGTVGAATIWLAKCACCCRERKLADPAVTRSDEQSHTLEPAAGPVSHGQSSPPAR